MTYIYICRTAPLTSRCCILYIYSTNKRTEYFKHAAHSPFFSSSKCRLFHNATFFGSCIIHILNTGVLKFKRKFQCLKVNEYIRSTFWYFFMSIIGPFSITVYTGWAKSKYTIYYILYTFFWSTLYVRGTQIFPKMYWPSQSSRCKLGDMNQASYWWSTNIRHHHTKFSHMSNLVPGICAPMINIIIFVPIFQYAVCRLPFHSVMLNTAEMCQSTLFGIFCLFDECKLDYYFL